MLQHLESLDAAHDAVPDLQRAHPRGGAGEDQIPGAQFVQPRERGHDVRHVPQHLTHIRLLAQHAVDLKPDAPVGRMAGGGGPDGRERRGTVETLSGIPGLAVRLGGGLQIAARQVVAGSVAEHVSERLRDGDVAPAAAERNDQLDLVLQIGGRRRIGNRGAVGDHGVRGLGEKYRGRALGLGAHLTHVIGVVAPDAVNAVHRKAPRCCGHGDARRRRRWETKSVHRTDTTAHPFRVQIATAQTARLAL